MMEPVLSLKAGCLPGRCCIRLHRLGIFLGVSRVVPVKFRSGAVDDVPSYLPPVIRSDGPRGRGGEGARTGRGPKMAAPFRH